MAELTTTKIYGDLAVTTLTGITIGNGTSNFTSVSSNTANQLLRRNTSNDGYEFWTPDYTSNAGTVTSVSGTGTVNGITLTGTVTSSGSLSLGGSVSINNSNWSGTDLTVSNGGTGLSSLTSGKILVGNGTSAINAETNLHWDNGNNRLGINCTSPTYNLDVDGTGRFNDTLIVNNDTSTTTALCVEGVSSFNLNANNSISDAFVINDTDFGFKPISYNKINGTLNLACGGANVCIGSGGLSTLHVNTNINFNNGSNRSICFGSNSSTPRSINIQGSNMSSTLTLTYCGGNANMFGGCAYGNGVRRAGCVNICGGVSCGTGSSKYGGCVIISGGLSCGTSSNFVCGGTVQILGGDSCSTSIGTQRAGCVNIRGGSINGGGGFRCGGSINICGGFGTNVCGDVTISNHTSNRFKACSDGSAYLYHNGSEKLKTLSDGIEVSDTINSTYLNIGGLTSFPQTYFSMFGFSDQHCIYMTYVSSTVGYIMGVNMCVDSCSTGGRDFTISGTQCGGQLCLTGGEGSGSQVSIYHCSGQQKLRTLTNGICVTGCGYATDWIASSDCRLKNNIQPISNALSMVNKLCGVCYEMCDDENHQSRIGLIAQDVEKVLPEVVSKNKSSEEDLKYGINDIKYGLKYDKLSAVLIEAIKEQQKEINKLKNQINNLK